MAAPSLRNAMIGAGMFVAAAIPAAQHANADSSETPNLQTEQAQTVALNSTTNEFQEAGYPVTFEYGPGINTELMNSVVRVVSSQGCEATATNNGLPKTIEVSTNGESTLFRDPNGAAGWALENCKG